MTASRRDILYAGAATLAAASMAPADSGAAAAETGDPSLRLGRWTRTRRGLPCYRYDGPLPAKALDRVGRDAQQSPDPAFILGNYRLTAFAHVSGVLQILTGERVWARVNAHPERMLYGVNTARLTLGQGPESRTHDLVGPASIAADPTRTRRRFGPGFATWEYAIAPGLTCRRVVSVRPSPAIHEGNPSLVVSVQITNRGRRPVRFRHEESVGTHYLPCNLQRVKPQDRPARYEAATEHDPERRLALARVRYVPTVFTVTEAADEPSMHDVRPVNVFLHAPAPAPGLSVDLEASTNEALTALAAGELTPGGTASFDLVIGLTYGGPEDAAAQGAAVLAGADRTDAEDGLFAGEWAARLPDVSRETNPVFRVETPWNAYVLEAMATYSDYFKETFVPQGGIYAYEDGEMISNRDHLQALLPLCWINPALAKSSLRFVLKQTTRSGHIIRGVYGHGYNAPIIYKESDAQLYLFMAIGEYLRVTRDYAFLDERVDYFPMEEKRCDTVVTFLQKHYLYLRDEVGLGQHGLIKILNSDWSDSFFHKHSPNIAVGTAESHLNSVMALAVMPRFVDQLRASGRADLGPFLDALDGYVSVVKTAYMKDLGDRTFSARAYLNGGLPSYGLDVVCLEPQGFLLQVEDLPVERKRTVYAKVKATTFTPEKIGFRIREKPIFGTSGGGEDGGVWFALEHQVVLGVISFDKVEAERLLETMSFARFSKAYPDYVLGRWTSNDCIQSSLHVREGLMNYWRPSLEESGIGFICHAHAWPLYNYLRLRET